jgi:hypothetical protein
MKYILKFTKNSLLKLITYFIRLIKYKYFDLQNMSQSKVSFFDWDWNKINFNRIALVNLLDGIGIIKVTNPRAELKDFHSQLEDKNFSYFFSNIKKILIIDWKDAQDWLKI